MWIRCENPATSTLYDEAVMGDEYPPPGVEFGESGVAQVTADVGDALVEEYDAIVAHEAD